MTENRRREEEQKPRPKDRREPDENLRANRAMGDEPVGMDRGERRSVEGGSGSSSTSGRIGARLHEDESDADEPER